MVMELGLVVALLIALALLGEGAGEDGAGGTEELVETEFRRGRRGNGDRRSQNERVSDS